MTHRVVVESGALSDMKKAYSYISREVSATSAEKWQRGVMARIASLENSPETWPLADEAHAVGFELRMILYRRNRHVHRILFRVESATVYVLRIRHASQDTLTADDF